MAMTFYRRLHGRTQVENPLCTPGSIVVKVTSLCPVDGNGVCSSPMLEGVSTIGITSISTCAATRESLCSCTISCLGLPIRVLLYSKGAGGLLAAVFFDAARGRLGGGAITAGTSGSTCRLGLTQVRQIGTPQRLEYYAPLGLRVPYEGEQWIEEAVLDAGYCQSGFSLIAGGQAWADQSWVIFMMA